MKIILTGTGASQNIPAFRCSCSVCSHARNTGNRKYFRKNSSAVVVPSSGEKILIDAPPQFMTQLEECSIDDRTISSLLLTHRHDDHLLGLFYLFSLKTSKGAVIDKALDIFHGPVTGEYIYKKFHSLTNPVKMKQMAGAFNFREVSSLDEFEIEGCSIVPLETNHLKVKSKDPENCREETYGFYISEKGRNLYYLVDSAELLPSETILFMENNIPDCIVIDCTYDDAPVESGHGDIGSVLVLRKKFPEGRMIVSHLSHKNHTPDVLEELLFPAGIELGYDGMEIIL